jgi:glycosyltransferase involved in cell wall biosynthesis
MRVDHLCRRLAARHDVTLLTYAPIPETPAAGPPDPAIRVEVVHRRRPSLAAKRVAQARSVVSRRPYICGATWSAEMQEALDALCAATPFDVIQLESSLMGAFRYPGAARLVLDEHNLEYEVFDRLAAGERSRLRRWFHRREEGRFRRFEQGWWRHVDGCLVTSRREEEILLRVAPATPVAVVPNGVDLDEFRPAEAPSEPATAVFNGLLHYRPNLDAAEHLVEEIWPLVQRRRPDARLVIVGRGDEADLRRLRRPGVEVTGEVPDIRPYLDRAAVVVVPVRMGGGTRLKVLEGLAMEKPMVSTTLGCEGVDVRDGEHLVVADSPGSFAAAVVRLFEDPAAARALGRAGRRRMEEAYSWGLAGSRLDALYDRIATTEAAP